MPIIKDLFDNESKSMVIPDLFSKDNNSGIYGLPGVQNTEQKIAEREDILSSIIPGIKKSPIMGALTPVLATKLFGGVAQRAQSAVANPLIELQKADVTQIQKNPIGFVGEELSQAGKGLTGKRIGEYGDIARNVGAPEPLAAGFGLLTDVGLGAGAAKALTPVQAAKTVKAFKGAIPRKTPEQLMSRAEKLTTEILQPSKGDLANYLERGEQMPAITEATQAIKKSRTYKDLQTDIDDAITETMNFRNKILKENNRPIKNYTEQLKKYISEQEAGGQATAAELRQMREVLKNEESFLNKRILDRMSGQERKEYLQKLTDSLLQKSEKGLVIDTQPARSRALDLLRKGLKQEIEGNDYKIAELNSRYGGLLKAKELIAGQEALAQKAIPQNILQRIIRIVTNPKDIPEEIARGAFERQGSLANTTKEIEKLVRKAKK